MNNFLWADKAVNPNNSVKPLTGLIKCSAQDNCELFTSSSTSGAILHPPTTNTLLSYLTSLPPACSNRDSVRSNSIKFELKSYYIIQYSRTVYLDQQVFENSPSKPRNSRWPMTRQVPCVSGKGRVPIRMSPIGVSWLIWLRSINPPKNKTVVRIKIVHENLPPSSWKIASVSRFTVMDSHLFPSS